MEVYNFSDHNSIYNDFLSELRDVGIQKDRMRFRRNLERLGEISAYEISKKLKSLKKDVITPLGTSSMNLTGEEIVLNNVEDLWAVVVNIKPDLFNEKG